MNPAFLLFWLAVGTPVAPATTPPPVTLHVVFHAEFDYMARVRRTSHEWWIADDRSAVKQGDRHVITREDLGLVWRIDAKAGTYTETRLPPRPTAGARDERGAAPAAGPDIHTVGYGWEPEYDWTVGRTGRTEAIAGRPCREFSAAGDADFAEAKATFWLCDPIPGAATSPSDAILGVLRTESVRRMVARAAASDANAWVLAFESEEEPAIAPRLVRRARVDALEASAAGPDAFELPSNLKKAGR